MDGRLLGDRPLTVGVFRHAGLLVYCLGEARSEVRAYFELFFNIATCGRYFLLPLSVIRK